MREDLTRRERIAHNLASEGKSPAEIAKHLGVREYYVECMIFAAKRKSAVK